ncbi:MAG: hypothetical protein ABIR24_14360, partial [Verrucomicrobiota bacterium]
MSAPSVITVQVNAETAGAVANLEKIIGSVHRLSGLGDFVSGLGARLAAAFTVGAVVKLTENAIRLDDEMGKMAERVGIGVQELSKLAYAAKLADVEAGEFEFGLKSFNKQIAEGSELFQTLGIELRNADGSLRSTSDILGDVAEKFSGFNAGANKSALAVELFGRAGTRLISFLNGGKKAIQEAGAELEKFGGVTTPEAAQQAQDFNDDITRLQTALHSIFRAFSENILPILKAFTERMIESKERTAGFVGVAQVLTTIVKLLATAFAVTATHILSVGQAIGVLTAINWELLQGKFRSARDMAVSAFDEIQARVLKTKETIEGIWASAKAPKLELPDEKKTEAPSTRGDVASQAKLNQSRLDQELKLQQSFNAIDAVENENRLKWQEQSITEFYAKKIEMAQDAAAEEQKFLFEQIAAAEKLMEASKDDLQKLAEATALRDQLRKESFVIENNLAAETKKLFAEKVEASLAAENEISAAR